MSVLPSFLFMIGGIVAIASICVTWRRSAPLVRELRNQVRIPEQDRTIRYSLVDHAIIRLRPNRGPLRHMSRRKPVKHRLQGQKPRLAAA